MRILIAGGGISGLATAHFLREGAARAGLPLDLCLLEASGHLGGKVLTETVDGFVVEGGPDAFLTSKPAAVALCQALGLADRLVPTRDEQGGVQVLAGGRLRRMPAGMRLIAPLRLGPFLRSDLLSWRGKLRVLAEPFLPARAGGDESVAAFVRRRLGEEAVARLAQPLLAGVYMADAERLSLASTFPQFRDAERDHGSIIRGLRAAQRRAPATFAGPLGRPAGLFVSLAGGMQELVDALAIRLAPVTRRGAAVAGLHRGDEGWRVSLADGSVLAADALVLATPVPVTARLVAGLAPELAGLLGGVRHVDSATVSFGYRADAVPPLPAGFGVVVARDEPVRVRALTFSSTKLANRAPPGHLLVRAFLGGAGREADLAGDDEALARRARADLAAILGFQAEPVLTRVFRWPGANPQYDVGHAERIAAVRAACPAGLFLAGGAYHGVGLPDCVRAAELVAGEVLAAAAGAAASGLGD